MPLAMAPSNVKLKVVKIMADDKLKKRLSSLGISENSEIEVLSHSDGNVICAVKDGRLALDRDISMRILVA